MTYIVKQQDIDILQQSNKQLFYKLELLNHNFKVIDLIEGNLIKDSFSIDANSSIRRTYNCDIFVSDSSFLIGSDKKIWIDKFIRPYIGITYLRTQEVIWYSLGTFIFNDTNYNYDATSRTLSLTCSDLMCTLNGDRGGQIEGLTITIPQGTLIRDAIIGLLNDAGITKYRVVDIGKTVPYDLEYSVGATYYDILKELVELYAGYEMFFDIDGTFVIQAIPTCKDDVVVLDETIMNLLLTSEAKQNSFNKVYNITQVWGSTIETDYYTQTSSSVDGVAYTATLDGIVTSMDNFGKYGVRIPITSGHNPTLNFNGLGAKIIVDDNGLNIADGKLLANTDYVFKYRQATDNLLFLGQYQAYGEYKQTANDCPFSTTNLGYEIKQILSYDNLESDSLCQQRAEYETWLATRFLDTIPLNMVCIPFLDVNWKVSYIPNLTGIKGDYIVKSISGSNSDFTMSITLMTFSELYPDIISTT